MPRSFRPEEHAARDVQRIAEQRGRSTLSLPTRTQRTRPGSAGLCPRPLAIQNRVALAQSFDLVGRQFDVANPEADRGGRNTECPRDLLDRLSILATTCAGFVALRCFHGYEQAYPWLRTEAGGGNRTRVPRVETWCFTTKLRPRLT